MPTLTINGTISFPLGAEATPPSRPFKVVLNYTRKNDNDVVLVGAQSNVSLMGTMTDAKAAFVEVVAGAGTFKINGAATSLPLDLPGGFWLWFDPAGGLTALTVTTSDDAAFRVYIFS